MDHMGNDVDEHQKLSVVLLVVSRCFFDFDH